MRVYLVRHGKASKDPQYVRDEDRPLTPRGRADVAGLAEIMAHGGIQVQQIRHSGLLRAQETAAILAEHLNPPGGVVKVAGLLWDDPVSHLPRELALETESVMLVGHNPFMERLAGGLLGAEPLRTPLWFATSSTACFELVEGQWSLKWALHRELIGDSGD